jgi:hypothetical protein
MPPGGKCAANQYKRTCRRTLMNSKRIKVLIFALSVVAVSAHADSLELKNGSLINGKFMGGSQTSISFQVGSSVQSYDLTDIRSLRFASEAQGASPAVPSKQPSAPSAIGQDEVAKSVPSVTIPAGTRISIRTSMPSTRPSIARGIASRLRSKNHSG